MPTDSTAPATYYVLLQSDLNENLVPVEAAYRRKFREENGEEYGDRLAFWNLTVEQAEQFNNRWDKILSQLSEPAGK